MVEFSCKRLEQWHSGTMFLISGYVRKGVTRLAANRVKEVQEYFGMVFDRLIGNGNYYLEIYEDHTDSSNRAFVPIKIDPLAWKQQMVNCATSYYLNLSMCYDLKSRKTIRKYSEEFTHEHLDAKSIKNDKYREAGMESISRKLYAAKRKYTDVISAMILKEKNDGFPYYDFLYALKKVNKELEEYTALDEDLSRSYKRAWLSPVALELTEWMAHDKFPFINLLFYRKVFQKGHDSYYSDRKLKEAYADYFQAIKSLKESRDPKEYVLGAFLIQQFEPVFEHMIAACLAKCRERLSYNVTMENLRLLTKSYWNCEILPLQFAEKKIKRKLYFKTIDDYSHLMNSALFAGRCAQLFMNLYEKVGYRDAHYIKKVLLDDMLRTLFRATEIRFLAILGDKTSYPVRLYNPLEGDVQARKVFYELFHRTWSDDDYIAASDFLHNEYPIIEKHISLDLDDPMKWSHSVIESIRDYFDPLFHDTFGFVRCEISGGEIVCPKCKRGTDMVKIGFTSAGVQ